MQRYQPPGAGTPLAEESGGPYEPVWQSERRTVSEASVPTSAAETPRGMMRARLPEMLEPQLATLVDHAPSDSGWVYEIKHDGYRVLARISRGKARLFTRNANDWTTRLPELARALDKLPIEEGWLDGEVVGLNADGKSDFQALQNALGPSGSTEGVTYCLFDLLFVDGHDLRKTPLVQRKAMLAKLLQDAAPTPLLQFSPHIEAAGIDFYEQACMHGLEGVVGKRRDGGYISGRSRTWVKLKCRNRQEFVIGGYSEAAGAGRKGLGALLLGVHDEQGQLRFAGKVGIGFEHPLLRELRQRLAGLEQPKSAFAEPPGRQIARTAHWVRPELVGEVTFTGWSSDNLVRQAAFEGLREDKPAADVVQEIAADAADGPRSMGAGMQAKQRMSSATRAPAIAGVVLSHADRVIFPSQGLSKLDVARYYEAAADWLLPHLDGRPLSVIRCPSGATRDCFFQKHLHEPVPAELQAELRETAGAHPYMITGDIAAVIRLVQLNVLELHTWGTRDTQMDNPDRMVLDLDPDPELRWDRVVEAAHLVCALLHELGLQSFPKTTGGRGLHLVVPLQPQHSWEEVQAFARGVADHLASVLPTQFTSRKPKELRHKRVYVDYSRNAQGATVVAPMSVRARPGAPVSVPLAWEEVLEGIPSNYFTLKNVPQRLAQLREDPWGNFWDLQQSITGQMKQQIGIESPASA